MRALLVSSARLDLDLVASNRTALMEAARTDTGPDLPRVCALLVAGARPNVRAPDTRDGLTALGMAIARHKHAGTCVRLLVEAGADPNLRVAGLLPSSLAAVAGASGTYAHASEVMIIFANLGDMVLPPEEGVCDRVSAVAEVHRTCGMLAAAHREAVKRNLLLVKMAARRRGRLFLPHELIDFLYNEYLGPLAV